jgi:hypothetical protein
MSDDYKIISKEVSKQISKEDCKVLAHLKRKHEQENKKYARLYGNK